MNKILFNNKGIKNAATADVFMKRGGYSALQKALDLSPEDIFNFVRESGLRGRGGAGFPAALKWKFVTQEKSRTVYLICNADEGEPGTFKDRYVMEFDPHLLLEGMAITAYAIGAHHGIIYLRGEYEWIADILEKAISEAQEKGCLGNRIFDTGFSFFIDLFRGAGAYVCGEETGLIESLEGKAGRPRLKPPFPATRGLYGEPTVIHNVTTLSFIPYIINHGPEAFKSEGKSGTGGTKLFGISGHVKRPGLYEYPMGTSLKELIYDAAGGIRGEKELKAVIPGGLSAPVLKADEIDVSMDYQSLMAVGTMLGSGGIIVLDENTFMPFVAQKAAKFFAHESCGQCAPCREGTAMIKILIDRLVDGEGTVKDIDQIVRLCRYIRGSTICAFGIAATLPITAMIKKFRDEFESLLK